MNIESVNNPRVKEWVRLKEKKYRDITNTFLIEGDHLLKEALKKNLVVEIISLDKEFEVVGIPFYLVNEAIMKKITNQVSISKVVAICKKQEENPIKGNVCILDNIQDPGNLGAIIRSAVAFNINTIILSNDTVDLYNDKVIRACEGMIFNLNFIKGDLKVLISKLKDKGYKIYGTDVNAGTDLKNVDFYEKTGIIMGNEGQGIKKELAYLCDNMLNIPISKTCESLNVAVAASIIFYEIERRIKC